MLIVISLDGPQMFQNTESDWKINKIHKHFYWSNLTEMFVIGAINMLKIESLK